MIQKSIRAISISYFLREDSFFFSAENILFLVNSSVFRADVKDEYYDSAARRELEIWT